MSGVGLIDRYLLRTALGATLACLVGLTAVIWITTALRELDLVTGKGQTVLVFLYFTMLSLPALIIVIAPVALFVATLYTLNKFNSDSELIVMGAAGVAPRRIARPFLALGVAVTALVALMTISIMPASFRELRDMITKIRADFVANLVKEGQFNDLEMGVVFHYRERAGDALLGIFFQDRREPDKPVVYLAERGTTVDVEGRVLLILEKGSMQRQDAQSRESSIVMFERYAVDLASFTGATGEIQYKPRERTTWDLLNPNPNDAYYQALAGRFRAELHDRFIAPLYVMAFLMIALAALSEAQTTRQGRGKALAIAVLAVVGLRIAGFAATSAMVRSPLAVPIGYLLPVAAMVIGAAIVLQRRAVEEVLKRLVGAAGRIASRRRAALGAAS